jgi:hypothetical protein
MGFPSQRTAIPFTDASGQNEASNAEVDPGPVMALINGEYDHDDDIVKRRGFQSLGSVPGGMLAHQLVSAGDFGGVLTHNALIGISGAVGVDPVKRSRLAHGMQAHVGGVFTHGGNQSASYGSVALSTRHLCIATAFGADTEVLIIERALGNVHKRVRLTTAAFAQVVQLSGLFLVYYGTGGGAVTCTVINADDNTIAGYPGDSVSAPAFIFSTDATYTQFCAVPDSSGGVLFAYKANGGGLTVATSTDGINFAASFTDTITDCESFAVIRNTLSNKVHVAYGRTAAGGGDARLVTYAADFSLRLLGPTNVLDLSDTSRFQPGIMQPAHTHRLYITGNTPRTGSFSSAAYATCLDDHTSVSTTTLLYDYYWLSAPFGIIAGVDGAFNAGTATERCYGLLMLARNLDSVQRQSNDTPTAWLVMLGPNISDDALDFASGSDPKYGDGYAGGVVPVAALVTDGGTTLPANSGWNGVHVPLIDPMRGPLMLPARDGQANYLSTPVIQSHDAGSAEHLANALVSVTPAYADSLPSPRVTIDGTSYVGGGALLHYDGSAVLEQTPYHPPVSIGSVGVGGGSNPPAGTYSYCGVLVYEDADGDVHRSAPSAAFSKVSAGGQLTTTWRGVLATLSLPADTKPLALEVYRTKDAGATFYLQSINTIVPGTDTTVVDTTSDVALELSRILYTNGGVLAAEPAPASTALAAHQDRLWLIDARDRRLLHYSKVREQGVDYEFNAALVVRVESQREPVALASMDDKLLIFTSRDCYAVTGQGPDATGVGGTFIPELCARGVGATGRHAALGTPIGTIVHTQGGFRLLGRDLSVQDIGKLLTDSAPGTVSVRASVYFPARQQAWFLLSNQYIAVFDHRRDGLRCSLFALASGLNSAALDLVDIGGAPHLLSYNSGDGKHYVYRQHETKSDDAGQFVPLAVQTGWFRIGGDTGLQDGRFRVLHVYGAFPEASGSAGYSGLTVGVEVQGEQRSLGTSESATFSKSNLNITNPSHVRMRLKRQRGYAARVTLAQVQDSGSGVDSRGYSPFGIEWEWAAVAPVAGRVGAAGGAGA